MTSDKTDARPPSGVPSPFAATAPTLLANGYSPMPVIPCDKVPGHIGERGWRPMPKWSDFCSTPPTPNKIKSWSRYPDAGACVALGRGVLAIDIDRDDLVEAVIAILPEPIVAKKGRKGLTIFFRADTSVILSRNFKDADGNGLLDILADGKQTVLPPSIHPAGMPYVYTTTHTLTDTRPDELTVYTAAHDAALLGLLKANGWREEKKATPRPALTPNALAPRERGSGELSELKAAALANLPDWVPHLGFSQIEQQGPGYRAVAEWRASGSGKALAARGRNLSIHPSGIVDFGTGQTFTAIDLVRDALGVDVREAIQWLAEKLNFDLAPRAVPIPLPPPVIEASYPDRRIPLAETEKDLRAAIESAFADFTKYHADNADHVAKLDAHRFSMEPRVPAILINSEMGLGKSRIAAKVIQTSLQAMPAGETLVYAVTRIELGEDIAHDLKALGVDARVLLGRDQDNPDNPQTKMCLKTAAGKDAIEAGANVYESICERKSTDPLAKPIRCPHFHECAYLAQFKAKPTVWIIPSNRLFMASPGAIPRPYALIVDEKFADGATDAETSVLTIDEIEHAKAPRIVEDRHILVDARPKLVVALRAETDGYVTRQALIDAGLTVEEARAAAGAEKRRWRDPGLNPSLPPRERKRRVAESIVANRGVKAMAGLFREVATVLDGDELVAGRLLLAFDEEWKARVVRHRPLRQVVDRSWGVPTLLLDGTAPPADVLTIALGRKVEVRADVSAFWSTQGRVMQYRDAPESKKKLRLGDDLTPRAVRYYWRHIWKRATEYGDRKVAVVAQEALEEKLEALGLPPNVATKHYNATAGSNDWAGEDVAGLIAIGRLLPPPSGMERDAETLTGRPSIRCQPSREGANPFYDLVDGGIRMRDGSVVATKYFRHPDPTAEALRWGSCEGELLQALFRIRPHRREREFFVDIFSNTPLPIIVDEVRDWKDAIPPACWETAPEGIMLSSAADITRAFPDLAPTERVAERMCMKVDRPPKSYIESHIEKRWRVQFSYTSSRNSEPATGALLPNWPTPQIPGDRPEWMLIRWLEKRLRTRVKWVEIDGTRYERHAQLTVAYHMKPRLSAAIRIIPTFVSPLTIDSAFARMREVIERAVASAGGSTRIPNGAALPERILGLISKGPTSARDLQNAIRPQLKAEVIKKALAEHLTARSIEVAPPEERPKGGKSAVRYIMAMPEAANDDETNGDLMQAEGEDAMSEIFDEMMQADADLDVEVVMRPCRPRRLRATPSFGRAHASRRAQNAARLSRQASGQLGAFVA